MANSTVQHIPHLFQDLDLQLDDLVRRSQELYFYHMCIRDTWREILSAQNINLDNL